MGNLQSFYDFFNDFSYYKHTSKKVGCVCQSITSIDTELCLVSIGTVMGISKSKPFIVINIIQI